MAAAGAMTLLCHRFHQPVVIGYLIAGFILGPHSASFPSINDLNSIHTMAELGLVFLLFSLGLEFNLPKIHKVGLSAGLATLLEVVGMMALGMALGKAFGWGKMDSLFLGAILCISSTTIIVKVFMDYKMMGEKFTQVVFGILILEDIVAIAILSILSTFSVQSGPQMITIVESFLRVGLFITLFLVVGLFIVPKLIHWVAAFQVKEVLGIVTLGLCLGGAMTAHAFQLSVALGAFLSGAVIAASKEINLIEEWIHPIRDMFSALFFVSAGMLIQPHLLWEYKGPIAIVSIVTIVGKVMSGAGGAFLAGYDIKTSAKVGMSLAQIGEFSFVIASLGATLKITSDFLYPMAVMVSSLTTLATPYLIRNSDQLVDVGRNLTPPAFQAFLKNVHLKIKNSSQTNLFETAIFSRYLLRLGVYLAILVALFGLLKGFTLLGTDIYTLSNMERTGLIVLWLGVAVLLLPLFGVISKYANHIVLLLVTKSKTMLHIIDIHAFYNALDFLTINFLIYTFLAASAPLLEGTVYTILGLIFILGIRHVFKKRWAHGKEWLEERLDQITGLATSEPTRQAVLMSGDRSLLLVDITDQVKLGEASRACGQTVREIKLREQTGATLVAIYRGGKHMANPGPDTPLLADDVLVILGDPDELEKAKTLLTAQ
ncbi:MAG: Glutathione-regulated potassium-efflux system protein KefB [Elusimicrobia bacterium]|nr:Glutathione-regulated potassium-efflux system protein KefB [Elusimicrobiota bacterium]